MARRETERDTYGGERRWSEGAGVSWAVHKTGPEHTGHARQREADPVLWRGSEQSASGDKGILRQLSDELGITNASPAEPAAEQKVRDEDRESLSHRKREDLSSRE